MFSMEKFLQWCHRRRPPSVHIYPGNSTACMVWLNLIECLTQGVRVTAAISLACAFFWRHYSAKSSVETLQCVHRRLEGCREQDSSAAFGLGFALSSAALGYVNWGNNYLLNKTDVFAFFLRKQRIS